MRKSIELPELPKDCTQDSDYSRPAARKAWKIIEDYLDGKIAGGDKVKTAQVAVNSHKGTLAAEGNKAALRMMAAKLSMREEDEDKADKIKLLK